VEYDEADEEDLPREEPFEDDSAERELALVALEAAALSRRIFPEEHGRRRISRAGRQVVLALALVDQQHGLTRWQLAHALAIDREQAQEALAELLAFDLIEHTEPWELEDEDEDEDEDEAYGLTAAGALLARNIAATARQFLPGWPPR
jgi:hypothetical protein